VIDRQVSHLVRRVDDLLDVSRITRGKIQLQMETLDAASVAATAVEISRPNIEGRSHRLAVRLPEEPLYVEADHSRLAQVLANLLNNAAKFTPVGGWTCISLQRDGDQAVFRVRDNGVGIPPEMITKVFDLFTQVDRSLDRSPGGLGVGLNLAKRLVEAHGGRIEAASEGAGLGSEFTVRLPAVNFAGAPPAHGAEPAPEPALAPSRVLVVDDNVDAADSLAWLLRLSGHETQIEYNGLAAIEAARRFRPQFVVLDLGLPGLDGYAVARRFRQDPATRDAVLIAVSGYGRPEDYQRSSEAGFDHHFVKPVDVNSLLELLSAAVADCESAAGVTP
jgi:CheY-like chemotaxis protein